MRYTVDKNDTEPPLWAEGLPGIPSDRERLKLPTSALLGALLGESRCCLVLGFILGWIGAGF